MPCGETYPLEGPYFAKAVLNECETYLSPSSRALSRNTARASN